MNLSDQPGYYQGTHFDVQTVITWGTEHGYDLSIPADVEELAAEYVKANLAPAGMAATTIAWKIRDTLGG